MEVARGQLGNARKWIWAGTVARLLVSFPFGFLAASTISWVVLAAARLITLAGPTTDLSWFTPARLFLAAFTAIVVSQPLEGISLIAILLLLILRDLGKTPINTSVVVIALGVFAFINLAYVQAFGARSMPLPVAAGAGLFTPTCGYQIQKMVFRSVCREAETHSSDKHGNRAALGAKRRGENRR